MKKVIATVICMVLGAVSLTASAAGLDVNKNRVLNRLKTEISVAGKSVSLPGELITQAENFLKRDDVVITAKQADKIISHINSGINIVKEAGVTRISELNMQDKTAILDNIRTAAGVLGLKVSINSTDKTITVLKDNVPVATTEAALKITGTDISAILVMVGVCVALIIGCFVVSWKARLIAK
jgi:hypothetical protein